jgi:hypothetical protein
MFNNYVHYSDFAITRPAVLVVTLIGSTRIASGAESTSRLPSEHATSRNLSQPIRETASLTAEYALLRHDWIPGWKWPQKMFSLGDTASRSAQGLTPLEE